jgi:tRNA (cmo5U34)-methyltransferase
MTNDKLFAEKKEKIEDFNFGKKTAEVFDDMLDRSVPYYQEMQRMISELTQDFAKEGTNVYDLGCSTANTFIALDPILPQNIKFVGIDYSPDMLAKAKEKLTANGVKRDYELLPADFNKPFSISNASVVIMNLTLQFVRPMHRHQLMTKIAEGLCPGGCIILVEKIVSKDPTLNRLFIKHYYEFKKRQGYSELEIAQKREALENVLIPYRIEENIDLLISSGFSHAEIYFRWYNFCGIIAVK